MTYDDAVQSLKKIINVLSQTYSTSDISKYLFSSKPSVIHTIQNNGSPQIKSLINFGHSCNCDILLVFIDKDDDSIDDLKLAERVYIHNNNKLFGNKKKGIPSVIEMFDNRHKKGPTRLDSKDAILNRNIKTELQQSFFADKTNIFSKNDLDF